MIQVVVEFEEDGWLAEVVLMLRETLEIKIEQSRFNRVLEARSPLDLVHPLYRV